MPFGKKDNKAPSGKEKSRRERQQEEFDAAKRKSAENFERAADKFIMNHPHGAPSYTPNPYPGVTCESRADSNGRYPYIRRPGGQVGTVGG